MKLLALPTRLYFMACLSVLLYMLPVYVQGQTKKSNTAANPYVGASYHGVNNGQYLKNWWLAGPIPVGKDVTDKPDMGSQEKFFDIERTSAVNISEKKFSPLHVKERDYNWSYYQGNPDIINLDSVFKKADYAVAYALAEIKADSAQRAFLAVGSDDGVKVWLNGKRVHKNWIPRALTPDEDLIPVSLVKGSNQLLIQVQDINQGWGFTARFLDKAALSPRLFTAISNGNQEQLEMLVNAGADIEGRSAAGLTPLGLAHLTGREEAEKFLTSKGARQDVMPSAAQLTDGLYDAANKRIGPGVAVLVAKDGKILYEKGFSYADIEGKKLISPETKFRIGSITKQFTASAILKLQEEGKLSVSDKLSKYIPAFPKGNEVSLHQLLTHTSGIHSYTGKGDFYARVTTPVKPDSLLAYFENDPYDFEPGENYQYNNSGYFLLGYIIEKVSGKSYEQYLKESFFDPLGMKNTGVHHATVSLDNEALGYNKENTTYKKALNWDMSWAGGAGALYSTVEDLMKWNEAVFNGKVLQGASLKAATTPVVLNGGKSSPVNYGYGWIMTNYRGQPEIQHSGGLDGFISQLIYYPKEKLTVVLLTNQAPPELNVDPRKVAEFFLWEKMDKQGSHIENRTAIQDLKAYEGNYDFFNGAVMMITSNENDLFAQLTNQPKFQIFPSGPGAFFWKVVDAKIIFIKNEKGEVTGAHFSQGGADLTVPKLKEEKIAVVDPALYTRYVGNYDLGDNMLVSISTSDKKIFAQATNQAKYEIVPLSDSVFLVKELNARLTFLPGADGKVNRFLLDMSGQKRELKKVE